jgi:hypothetical protein
MIAFRALKGYPVLAGVAEAPPHSSPIVKMDPLEEFLIEKNALR